MNNVFLVLGYGVPRDILKDENYNFYLKMIFNRIYDFNTTRPLIIFCGGNSDCFKPYKRNEADEMIKLFKKVTRRSFVRGITKDWFFISEKKSLSTLENFLNSRKILQKRKIRKANLYIFCEKTREKRIKFLSKRIFNKNYNIKVIATDFSLSPSRYLDPKFLTKKEKTELKHSLWALQSAQNLKMHHELFKEKIDYLRKIGHRTHEKGIKEWWEGKLKYAKSLENK